MKKQSHTNIAPKKVDGKKCKGEAHMRKVSAIENGCKSEKGAGIGDIAEWNEWWAEQKQSMPSSMSNNRKLKESLSRWLNCIPRVIWMNS